MINFITDLDDTLIYSKKSLDKCVCVDICRGREVCFITEQANITLKKLMSNSNFRMIPCTARSYEQTMRISFINEYLPKYMICDLGASIYIDGKKDEEWEKHLLSQGIIYPEKLIDLRDKIEKTADLSRCRKIVSNSDYFLVFCFRENEEASDFYSEVNTIYFMQNKFSFSQYKSKVYCYPNKLDKSLAVLYLKSKFKLSKIITAGDSLFDYKFNKLSDISILPKHAEFKIGDAIYCEEERTKSGEYILEYLYDHFINNNYV